MEATVVRRPEALEDPQDLVASAERLPPRERILLADPTYYDVTRADNPHTVGEDGGLHRVDRELAQRQWRRLREAYVRLGYEVEVLDPEPGLPDLVFCCNTVWPFLDPGGGSKRFIPGRMRYEGRRGEVPQAAAPLEALGYEPAPLPESVGPFECGGDLQWLGDRRLALAGTGERTSPKALEAAAEILGAPLLQLTLVDPAFYHLDTCLAVLDGSTIAWVPAAFDDAARSLLSELPVERIELPEEEAQASFAANLHCPDGETVLIDEENERSIDRLARHGFDVLPLDTSEFRKAGGSVFCMRNQLW